MVLVFTNNFMAEKELAISVPSTIVAKTLKNLGINLT